MDNQVFSGFEVIDCASYVAAPAAATVDVSITSFPLHVRGRFGIDDETWVPRDDRSIDATSSSAGRRTTGVGAFG